MSTLFTVRHTEQCGFTDQLTSLATFHDIGVRCGYDFRWTPFAGERSGRGFWSHYDLSRVFAPLSPAEARLPAVRIDLSRNRLLSAGVRGLADLPAFVAAQVPAGTGLVEFDADRTRFLLDHFAWDRSPGMRAFHARMRSLFAPSAGRDASVGTRVVVHLRCGDVTDVPLVGPVSYRAWGNTTSIARPFWPTPFHGARLVIDTIRAQLAPGRVGFRVHTDGYERTRSVVSRSAEPGGTITPATRDLLLRSMDIQEEIAEGLFRAEDVSFSTGESFDSLRNLIDDTQHADLIVVTHAQRMIPKFLALLGPRQHVPGLLLLDPSARAAAMKRGVRMDETVARLITLSEHGDPLAPLRVFLESRSGRGISADVAALVQEEGMGPYCVPEVEALAARLEADGRAAEAEAIDRWLALLTDGSPESLAGLARRSGAGGDRAVADAARRLAAEAAERCAAGYRASIEWAQRHGFPLEARALALEGRRLAGPDADVPEPGQSHPRRRR